MAKVKRFRGGGSLVAAAAPEDKEPSRQLKSKGKPFTRTLETADAGGKYPVKPSSPKVATAGGNSIIKRPPSELATRAGKLVFSAADAAKSGRLGRTAQVIAGALDPSELGAASLSNEESAKAVKAGAFKQDSEPKSKTATAVASKSEGTSPRTDYKPLKDFSSVKEEPVTAIKKQTVTVKTPPAKSSNGMADMAAEWAKFSKGRESDTAALKDITDRYEKTGTLVNMDDENARTKTEATEATEAMKKGGMTKRPPKPAKKVPPRKFASGGNVSRTSASKRGDGCATKGHTKGKYL
jgi:hypothetical protein